LVNVSSKFKDAIYGQERKTVAKVIFEMTEFDKSDNDVAVTVNTEHYLSSKNQVVNGQREMSYKFATFERDYFKLDGSFNIPPTTNADGLEFGWWSDNLSGEDGVFFVKPVMELSLSEPITSAGFSISFDTNTGEYATHFSIDAYNEAGVLIHSERVTDNDSDVYNLQKPIENYKRIVITIDKWIASYRRARIAEVDFGIIKVYSGENLISLKIVEEMDLLTNVVPSNELSFVVDNSDKIFNILNPDRLHEYIKENMKIEAKIGLQLEPNQDLYEYIKMGRFYLTEWTVDEGAMTVSIVGRSIFNSLEKLSYSRLLQSTNLYDLAEDIFSQANITDYKIDEKLKEVNTSGFTEPINMREALQLIAITGQSVIKEDRNGIITLERFEPLKESSGYITYVGPNNYVGMTTPQVVNDYTFKVIDFDNAFEIPKVSLNQSVFALKFKIHDHTLEEPYEFTVLNSDETEGETYEINNPLINSEALAIEIAEWMIREYSIKIDYVANWRQNPALECGEIIAIENEFDEKKKARITKQEFEFSGYLDGITEAKGGI
jgi:hypothetical protein